MFIYPPTDFFIFFCFALLNLIFSYHFYSFFFYLFSFFLSSLFFLVLPGLFCNGTDSVRTDVHVGHATLIRCRRWWRQSSRYRLHFFALISWGGGSFFSRLFFARPPPSPRPSSLILIFFFSFYYLPGYPFPPV